MKIRVIQNGGRTIYKKKAQNIKGFPVPTLSCLSNALSLIQYHCISALQNRHTAGKLIRKFSAKPATHLIGPLHGRPFSKPHTQLLNSTLENKDFQGKYSTRRQTETSDVRRLYVARPRPLVSQAQLHASISSRVLQDCSQENMFCSEIYANKKNRWFSQS